jgi:hypothetical protein
MRPGCVGIAPAWGLKGECMHILAGVIRTARAERVWRVRWMGFLGRSMSAQGSRPCGTHSKLCLRSNSFESSLRRAPALGRCPWRFFAGLAALEARRREHKAPPLASRVTPALCRRRYCKRLPLLSSAGVGTLLRAACWIIGPMRRARYLANLRAAGEMVLGASVLIDARVLLAGSPAVLFVISSF